MTGSRERLALAAILAVAAGLRAWGLGFGLPAVYNPDEVAIMSRALAFATGDLNPHNFLYPTFFFYVLFAWVGASFVPAWLAGVAASPAEFQAQFFADPTWVYLAGRWLGVTCGVASVAATWALARRVFGRDAGLAAALLLAVAPIAVRDAHYVKHDVPVTLAVVLAVIAIARLLPAGRSATAAMAATHWKPLALAGAACGVAFSTHYYSVFLALPLAFAVWLARGARGPAAVARALAIAGITAAVVFFLLSPFLLPEWRTALRDIIANRQIVVDRAAAIEGSRWLPSAGEYLVMLWREGTGWPAIVLALAGLAVSARHDWRTAVLLLAFPVAFLLFISNTVAASRYLNPVLPFVAVFAGAAIAWLARGDDGRRERRWRVGSEGRTPAMSVLVTSQGRASVAAFVAVVAAAPGAIHSARTGHFFTQDDTRTLAQRFIESHAAPGTTVLLQPYSVPLQQSREGLIEALTQTLGDPARASTKFARRLALDPAPAPAYRTLYLGDGGLDADKLYVSYAEVSGPDPLAALHAHGVELVVWKRYDPPEGVARDLVAALNRGARRLAVFSPYLDGGDSTAGRPQPFLHNTDTPVDAALARPGPVVEVWGVSSRF